MNILLLSSRALPRNILPCPLCGRNGSADVLRHLDTEGCIVNSAIKRMVDKGYVRVGAAWAVLRKAGIPTEKAIVASLNGDRGYADWVPEWAYLPAVQFAWPVKTRLVWLRGLLAGRPDPQAFWQGYDALRRLGGTALERQRYIIEALQGPTG